MEEPTPKPKRLVFLQRPPWKGAVEVNLGLFEGLLLTYLGLLLVESLREGTVSRYFPLNYLLVAVIATGILAGLTIREEPSKERKPVGIRHYVFVGLLAVGSWLILWYKLQELGWIQYPVSILGGLLVGLVALSILLPEPTGARTSEPEPKPGPTVGSPAPAAPEAKRPPAPRRVAFAVKARVRPNGRLHVVCPRCLRPSQVPKERLGSVISCPACRANLTINP